ncbi:MAG TPA: hypothetical protein VLV87_04910 [Gammaproteobacteria bacterium]|nr:hypothetical protein [Gammaproteobacteria bacterium]
MADDYPGGEERARWHLVHGLQLHSRHFGAAPSGCWPSEGAVSAATIALLNWQGFRWTASGQRVLLNSLGVSSASSDTVHRVYQLSRNDIALFFRDDELSDLIGFKYQDWHAEDAVADLTHRLAAIADEPAGPGRVVCIILDGENPWEYYPENGRFFLSELYRRLAEDPRFMLTTFSRCLDDASVPRRSLERLCAGSWVFGDLSTWMGHADKNQAWDMLVDARKQFLATLATRRRDEQDMARLERQLAVCEGSDWFWWPGEYNPEASVSEFEHLFRVQLAGLYHLIGVPPPDYLAAPFSHGATIAEGGMMRPARPP